MRRVTTRAAPDRPALAPRCSLGGRTLKCHSPEGTPRSARRALAMIILPRAHGRCCLGRCGWSGVRARGAEWPAETPRTTRPDRPSRAGGSRGRGRSSTAQQGSTRRPASRTPVPPCTSRMRYDRSTSTNSATSLSGLNGGFTRGSDRGARGPWPGPWWAMASVKLSALPARIGEGDVRHVGQWRQLVPPAHDRGIERLAGEVAFGVRSKLPRVLGRCGDGSVGVGRGNDPRIEVRMRGRCRPARRAPDILFVLSYAGVAPPCRRASGGHGSSPAIHVPVERRLDSGLSPPVAIWECALGMTSLGDDVVGRDGRCR